MLLNGMSLDGIFNGMLYAIVLLYIIALILFGNVILLNGRIKNLQDRVKALEYRADQIEKQMKTIRWGKE